MGQEIRTTHAGEITEVLFAEGSDVQVGEILFKVDTSKAGQAPPATSAPASEPVATEQAKPAQTT